MPMYDYKLLLSNEQHVANANANSTLEMDFGVESPDVGKGGMFGAHVVVSQAFTNTTPTYQIWIMHGPTTGNVKLTGRFFTGAQLAVLGAHYFIPAPPGTLLQFAKLRYIASSSGAYGKVTSWFGPDLDGAI